MESTLLEMRTYSPSMTLISVCRGSSVTKTAEEGALAGCPGRALGWAGISRDGGTIAGCFLSSSEDDEDVVMVSSRRSPSSFSGPSPFSGIGSGGMPTRSLLIG